MLSKLPSDAATLDQPSTCVADYTSIRDSVLEVCKVLPTDTRENRLEEMQASFSQLSSSIQTIRAWLEAVGCRTMAAVILRSRVA